jgi:hypothetical protein
MLVVVVFDIEFALASESGKLLEVEFGRLMEVEFDRLKASA